MPRITSKGQVTIPKGIRDELHIKPGDEVSFRKQNGQFVLQRQPIDPAVFEKWRGHAKELRGKDIDELIDEMRGE